jgi:hypothetical protein
MQYRNIVEASMHCEEQRGTDVVVFGCKCQAEGFGLRLCFAGAQHA